MFFLCLGLATLKSTLKISNNYDDLTQQQKFATIFCFYKEPVFWSYISNFCQKAQENIFKCTLFYSLLSPKMHKKVWQRNLQISLSATHFRCSFFFTNVKFNCLLPFLCVCFVSVCHWNVTGEMHFFYGSQLESFQGGKKTHTKLLPCVNNIFSEARHDSSCPQQRHLFHF